MDPASRHSGGSTRTKTTGSLISIRRALCTSLTTSGPSGRICPLQFNTQLWAVFDSKPVERFIIDLRNNAGGDSSVLNPFLASGAAHGSRFLITRPILIIGRHTFSSAIINAVQMRQGPVRVMGEPSGGARTITAT